jgi:hypothetical protein
VVDEADLRTAATDAVAVDVRVGRILAEREATIISNATALYTSGKLTPEWALGFWAQMAELQRVDGMLERRARVAISEAEKAMTEAGIDE